MLVELPASLSRSRYRIANIALPPGQPLVMVDKRPTGFTVREFELFSLLARRPDCVVQRPEIYEWIWGSTMPPGNRSVDVLVRKVRRRLEDVAPDWRYIHTHFGIGYRFTPERLP